MTIIYAEIYESRRSVHFFTFFFGSFPWLKAKRAVLSVQIFAALQLKYPFVWSFVLQINPRWTAPPHPRMRRRPRPRPPPATISRAGSAAARAATPVAPEEGHRHQEAAALHCVSSIL